MKTNKEILEIVNNIGFLDRKFILLTKGDGYLLQMTYLEPDIYTKKLCEQKTRKWYISPHCTESEIVQTALKCVLTSQEHVAREFFIYKGLNIFQPHYNVNDLLLLRLKNVDDKRL